MGNLLSSSYLLLKETKVAKTYNECLTAYVEA